MILLLQKAIDFLWWKPLEILYFQGPLLFGYGFWCGKNKVDVCAELTEVPAAHWSSSPYTMEICESLLENHYNAFAYGVTFLGYFIVVGCTVCGVLFQTCCLRPIIYYALKFRSHTQ